MQTITTRYVGPTNFKGSRIIATASGNNERAIVSYDCAGSSDEAHAQGVKALCAKLGWTGELIAGHTRDGMVWVFIEGISPRLTVPKTN